MEITKFRSQLSSALERVTGRFWQVRRELRKLTRSAAEEARRLGHELRTRGSVLRVSLATKTREAIVAANSKITKAKTRVFIAFERGAARLREARNRLARSKRSVAEKLQKLAEQRRARKDEMRVQAARSREATVKVDRKITKVKAKPSIAPEQWTAHLLDGQNPLAGLTRSMAEKPQRLPEELRAQEEGLRAAEARPREAIVAPAAPKLQPPRAERSKITKVKARLSVAFEQRAARLRQTRKTLAGLGRNIVNRRQRRRQDLGTRESQMRELLANSQDAIAVINGDHCFVTANRRALDLFGVSERNLSKFSIDVFLFRGQIRDLHQNGSFFMGRQEKHGQCVIRRLDGNLRVAEFAFVTDFLPLQHLCRFYDLHMPQRPTPKQQRISADHVSLQKEKVERVR